MPKQKSGSKKCGRGGSPKKAIKRLRRKAIATLREARLTAQLELVAAEAAAAQLRERALEAAADETAQVRADAHGEIARLLEQSRLEAATAALEQRATAEAEARALLAEAELNRKIELLIKHFGSQRSKDWFDAETFRGLARLRGMECRAKEGFAEGFTVRKVAWSIG